MEHTKGPWKSVEGWAYSHDGTQYNVMRIVDKDNTDVLAKIKDREANAEFIVRACNSHDELVDVLHACSFWFETSRVQGGEYSDELIQQAKEAIRKAI